MKRYITLLSFVFAAALPLHSAPSEEAQALVAHLQLSSFTDLFTKTESGLPPEKDKILKEEFSAKSFGDSLAEHFDTTYSKEELREMNDLWKNPAMVRLFREISGKDASMNKFVSAWMQKYNQRKVELVKGTKTE